MCSCEKGKLSAPDRQDCPIVAAAAEPTMNSGTERLSSGDPLRR
jgi:hypothetical protein